MKTVSMLFQTGGAAHRTHTFTKRLFSTAHKKEADFTHAVIGAGAVGLAIARRLASRAGTSTLLIERHGIIGSETSSRNSEVIHAGLYYGHDTLKTKLCIRGKHLMYQLCADKNIPHRNTRKWILAQDERQMREIEKVHGFSKEIDVPTRFLSRSEIQTREPDVRAEAGVLESESTGIIDSHAFMSYLEADFLDQGGDEALHTTVTGIERTSSGTYMIHSKPSSSSPNKTQNDPIEVETLINSGGLSAISLSNSILPPHRHIQPVYAKGSYFSYSSRHPRPSVLLYPAPDPSHGGLGTHLTLDMTGRVRFGPDVEWITDPTDLSVNRSRLPEAIAAIRQYLPSIDPEAIDVDYCGIRPKLGKKSSGTSGPGFVDFYIKEETEEGLKGLVNLLGIESPGLTSSLAIAEYVEEILYGSLTDTTSSSVIGREEADQRGKKPEFNFMQ